MLCARCSSRNSRLIPLLRRCQEKEEEEGIVSTNKSNSKPVSSWRCQRQAGAMKVDTPASSLELDLPRVRGAHGERGGAVKSGAHDERKRPLSNSPSGPSMEEDALL